MLTGPKDVGISLLHHDVAPKGAREYNRKLKDHAAEQEAMHYEAHVVISCDFLGQMRYEGNRFHELTSNLLAIEHYLGLGF